MTDYNEINKEYYELMKKTHLKDGGKHSDAYAITEVIKKAILNKSYKIYYGGGYEYKTENPIKKWDVVVWFNFGGDPFFQMVVCTDEGDCCNLVNSNADCTFVEKCY